MIGIYPQNVTSNGTASRDEYPRCMDLAVVRNTNLYEVTPMFTVTAANPLVASRAAAQPFKPLPRTCHSEAQEWQVMTTTTRKITDTEIDTPC